MLLRGVRVIWAIAVIITAFVIFRVVAPADKILEELRIFQLSVGMMMAVSYGPEVWKILRGQRPAHGDLLILGVFLTGVGFVLQGVWFLLWRLGGKPNWMLDATGFAAIVLLLVIAAVLHVLSPGAIGAKVPRRNLLWLGVAVGITFGLVTWIYATRPNATAIVDWLEPFFR
jgi:hypothetical protein